MMDQPGETVGSAWMDLMLDGQVEAANHFLDTGEIRMNPFMGNVITEESIEHGYQDIPGDA